MKSSRRDVNVYASREAWPIIEYCPIIVRHGDPCGKPALPVAPFAICSAHARELYSHLADYVDRAKDDPVFRLAVTTQWLGQHRKREADKEPPSGGFVYYVQIGHHIKIGHTVNLQARMRSYPPSRRLLAVEDGSRQLEGIRLREFRHLLDAGQEWHRPGTDLVEHINRIREASGASPIPIAA